MPPELGVHAMRGGGVVTLPTLQESSGIIASRAHRSYFTGVQDLAPSPGGGGCCWTSPTLRVASKQELTEVLKFHKVGERIHGSSCRLPFCSLLNKVPTQTGAPPRSSTVGHAASSRCTTGIHYCVPPGNHQCMARNTSTTRGKQRGGGNRAQLCLGSSPCAYLKTYLCLPCRPVHHCVINTQPAPTPDYHRWQ